MARRGSFSSDELNLFRGGTTPFQRAGQLALSRTPEAFDFTELEEMYPTRQVTPLVPSFIQQQLDEETLRRKSEEVALKTAQARLNVYDAQLNQQNAIAEQIPMARQRFAQIDPASENYPQMRDQILIEFPQVEYDPAFMRSVVGRLDSTHGNFMKKARGVIDEGGVGLREYQSAMGEISKYARLQKTDGITQGELEYLKDMEAIVDQYRAQQGGTVMPQGEPPLSPEPTEDMVEPQPVNIPPPEEDDEIYSEATAVIARNPALKDRVNQRLIQMGRKPID
jgi:hypothetical protein